MLKGTVKWFSDQRGYGFIEPEAGGNDVFIHYSSIDGEGFKTLSAGDVVRYELTQAEKGPRAVNVEKLQPWALDEDLGQPVGVPVEE